MKSYFVLGKSRLFREYNVTRNFEKHVDAVECIKNYATELGEKFNARIKRKNNGHLVEVILKDSKITFELYKYVHEAPIGMYNRA